MTIVVSKFAEWHEDEKKTNAANNWKFKAVQLPVPTRSPRFSDSKSPKSNISSCSLNVT